MLRVRRILLILLLLLLLAVYSANVLVHLQSRSYIYASLLHVPYAQVALVLGAPLMRDGTPTPIFTERADTAVALYKNGKVEKIIVSGDNVRADHREVSAIQTYLVAKGIPEQYILLDPAGLDTYSSMHHAKEIFNVTSMIIASQSFHLPRAVFIARSLGIQAYGLRSDTGSVLLRNYVRELFANEKAVADVVLHVTPRQ